MLGSCSMKTRFGNPWLVCAALVACVLGVECRALAVQEPPLAADATGSQSAPRARTVVLLQSTPVDTVGLDFVPNLRWQLAELELTLTEASVPVATALIDTVQEAERIAVAANALLVAWVSRQPTAMNVYLLDPIGPHLYAREVAVSESPSAASEELSLILRSAIQARIDGSDLDMAEILLPKPEPTKARVTPPAPPPPSRTMPIQQEVPDWGVGASSVVERPFSPGHWQAGLGLRSWAKVHRFRFGLGYSIFPGLAITSENADIELQRHPMEGFVGLQLGAAHLVVVAETGFGADLIRRQTTSAAVPLSGLVPNSRWLWALSQRVRLEARLASPLWFTMAGGLEVPLNPYTFDFAIAERRLTLARVLPVRPTVEIGLVLGWK